MVRPAPAVVRVTRVLDFLAEHPTERFTMTEIADTLEMNSATVHAMLFALADAGFLVRESNRYSLGPALIKIGSAAIDQQRDLLVYAEREIGRLAKDLSRLCGVTRLLGNEIVTLSQAGAEFSPYILRVGLRQVFAAPLGAVFVAWSSHADIAEWVQRSTGTADDETTRSCIAAAHLIRERGYSIGLTTETRPGSVGDDGRAEPSTDENGLLTNLTRSGYFLLEFRHDESYNVRHITAPVFNADGDVALALSVLHFEEEMTASQIESEANRVMKAAHAITETIHGVRPNAVQSEGSAVRTGDI